MLIHFGVIPYLIFDGDYLPSKAGTETDREKRRHESKRLGFELLNAGRAAQAQLEFKKAIDVTPEMARELIDELKKIGVKYIVAPYEADAQMVYLERKGVIQGILSEDSDLLVFGAQRLLTKLDQYGNCIEVNKADFCKCREINLTGWSEAEFRRMAILSGCDYLNSITNMGLKNAHRMVRKHKTIEKVIRMLQFDGKYHVPTGYLEAFYQAESTFLYQRVYCPELEMLVLHTEPDNGVDVNTMPFIGAYVEPEVAKGVAVGDLHPMTKERLVAASYSPARKLARRHTAIPEDPKKKGVSISEFFKPKRVPLAEMDPNCFKPSPSQQQALLRNGESWVAEPIQLPRPYMEHTPTESELPQQSYTTITPAGRPTLRHAVTDVGQQLNAFPSESTGRSMSIGSFDSTAHPAKRTRLCSDGFLPMDDGPEAGAELSRFFDTPANTTLSAAKASKSNRRKKDEIQILSDDSIEEALLELPDYDAWQQVKPKHKSFTIFNEKEFILAGLEQKQEAAAFAGGDSKQTTTLLDAEPSTPALTQGRSQPSLIDDVLTPPDSAALTSLSALAEKFAFTPSATPATFRRQPITTTLTTPSSSKPSKIPRAVKVPIFATPLQSLGAKAIHRATAFTMPLTPPYTPTDLTTQRLGRKVPFPEVFIPSKLANMIEPCEVPLPAQNREELKTLVLPGASQGSEDLIVPDSEDEDSGDDCFLEAGTTSKLSLERFAFQAR
jgi:exonuclease-1